MLRQLLSLCLLLFTWGISTTAVTTSGALSPTLTSCHGCDATPLKPTTSRLLVLGGLGRLGLLLLLDKLLELGGRYSSLAAAAATAGAATAQAAIQCTAIVSLAGLQ